MADMNTPGSEYLQRYLLERSMTAAQKARGETPAQKKRRQKQQADRKKNDPERKKQIANQTSNYDKENPKSRKTRDKVANAKKHKNGENAKELKKQGLDVNNQKCAKCGSTDKVQADHVQQNSNSKYTGSERMQWLCNKCHQAKTAQKRKEKGQEENQYGRAKIVKFKGKDSGEKRLAASFERRLHGTLQALFEAPNEGEKRQRRAQKMRNKEVEGKRGERPNAPPIRKDMRKETDDPSTWNVGKPIQRRPAKKRKIAGRRMLPKYKMSGNRPILYFRNHPKYQGVLEVVDTSGVNSYAKEIYNDLYKLLNNIEYHRTYRLSADSLDKYGLTNQEISGRELGIEEDTVYEFVLSDSQTKLLAKGYTTDYVTYSFKDFGDGGKIHHGQIIDIDDSKEGVGKDITFRDLTGQTMVIYTNEKVEDEQGGMHYRYGLPDANLEQVNRYYWTTDEFNRKIKKHEYSARSSIGLSGGYDEPDKLDVVDDAIEKIIAPQMAAREMDNIFLRDAYQSVQDEREALEAQYAKRGQQFTQEEFRRLAAQRKLALVSSPEGKKKVAERAAEIAANPSNEVKRRAMAWYKQTQAPKASRNKLPADVELYEDVRPSARIFEVTRESGAGSYSGVEHSWDKKRSRWKSSSKYDGNEIDDEYDNPADLNRSVYTLYDVEVASPNPDHDLMRYLINGYRPIKDFMSNYSATLPQMMLASPPQQVDHKRIILKVKNSNPEIDEETGKIKDPWVTLGIDMDDVEAEIPKDDSSFFAEVNEIREAYKNQAEAKIDQYENPEIKQAMTEALAKAYSETTRRLVQDEGGEEIPESDRDYLERTSIRALPLDERTLSAYNFYTEKEENGKVVWPALETSEIRQDARLGLSRKIRYAIPKSINVLDTFDMEGNLQKGLLSSGIDESTEWLNLITHSENYDSFGMVKPTSERSGRQVMSSSGMRFHSFMTPADYALEIITPYLMKLDPDRQLAYVERSFSNAWNDPDRRKIMETRAITTLATQRALDKTGSEYAWYNLSDSERDERFRRAKEELEKDFIENDIDALEQIKIQALENYRIQSLSSLNRQMGNTRGICPKCMGQQYLRVTVDMEDTGDLRGTTTQKGLKAAIGAGKVTYQKATVQDYEMAKEAKRRKKPQKDEIIPCNACGGTGEKLKEKTSMLYAGQKTQAVSYEAFTAAMDGAIDFDDEDDKQLVSRTMKALFPSRLTELTRTSIPAAQINPFLWSLTDLTQAHLNGELEVEGALNPVRTDLNIKGKFNDCIVYDVPVKGGTTKFFAPVKSNTRYLSVKDLVDEYGEQAEVSKNIYIEAKEDPESYLLHNVASIVTKGYGDLEEAIFPEVMSDYKKMAALNYNELSPEGKQQFLKGRDADKRKFEELISNANVSDEQEPASAAEMQKLMKPWVTKTILKIVYVKPQTSLTDIDKLGSALKKLDRTEDPSIERDNKFYAWAAEAYRRALLDRDISKEDFINDTEMLIKYWNAVKVGDTRPMLADEIEERGIVLIGCKDVSTGTDVILRYNLDNNPDQRLIRVWPISNKDFSARTRQAKDKERKQRREQEKVQAGQQTKLENLPQLLVPFQKIVSKLDVDNRLAERKILSLSRSVLMNLKHNDITKAAKSLNGILSKLPDRAGSLNKILGFLMQNQLPKEQAQELKNLLSGMQESHMFPILAIAEEIDTDDSRMVYTPDDIADWID